MSHLLHVVFIVSYLCVSFSGLITSVGEDRANFAIIDSTSSCRSAG